MGDVGVPQLRFGSAEDWIDGKHSEIDDRDDGGSANRLFDVRIGAIGDGLGVARRGSVIHTSACMRLRAMRQLMSFRAPFFR